MMCWSYTSDNKSDDSEKKWNIEYISSYVFTHICMYMQMKEGGQRHQCDAQNKTIKLGKAYIQSFLTKRGDLS